MGRPAAVLLLLATAALAPRPAFGEGGQGAKPPAAAPEADREVSLAKEAVARARKGCEAADANAAAGGPGPRRIALVDLARVQEGLAAVLRRKKREPEALAVEKDLAATYAALGDLAHATLGGAGAGAGGGKPGAFEETQPGKAAPVAPLPPSLKRPVDAALDWLARHQGISRGEPGWACATFGARCEGAKCGGAGREHHDTGVTGLALLAFLGAGETHETPRHGRAVKEGLQFLVGLQDREGCYGTREWSHFVYGHAIAALAVAEAYRITGSPLYRIPTRKAVSFIAACQNPYLGWRYGVRPQESDTSVTGWMVEVLRSAAEAGEDVPEETFLGALAWLDGVTEREHGRVGYTEKGDGPCRPQEYMDLYPADRTEAMTGSGVHTRFLCGQGREHPLVTKGVDLLKKCLPAWGLGSVDFYYWRFGTLAMRDAAWDEDWKAWRLATEGALIPRQVGEAGGCARGSWDAADPWKDEGGRVYSTAMAALALEACARPLKKGK